MKEIDLIKTIDQTNLVELDDQQLNNTNGGLIPIILAAIGLYSGALALAYGAGALYGIIEDEL